MRRNPKWLCLIFAALVSAVLVGCAAPSASFNLRVQNIDPRFSAVALAGGGDIAVLPFMTSRGPIVGGDFGTDEIYDMLKKLRPDLKFVPREVFERSFPPRFDRRRLTNFYGWIFDGVADSVASMDSLWGFVEQQYLLVFAIADGAVVHGLNDSYYKHVRVTCEVWCRRTRRAVWQSSCMGVSDDSRMEERDLLAESVRRIIEAIPAASPTTTGNPAPRLNTGERR
ncbi:MAG: hypothetical protein LBU70_08020 [Chitinispirillales bacterium]|jgi:hypothetical protein|nr:hypothetical protein [Chitinispirillales bacterium]